MMDEGFAKTQEHLPVCATGFRKFRASRVYWFRVTGVWVFGFWVQAFGYWVLDVGPGM